MIVASEQPSAENLMTETVLNYSPLAPAITLVPPNDRRCTRAAGSPGGRIDVSRLPVFPVT